MRSRVRRRKRLGFSPRTSTLPSVGPSEPVIIRIVVVLPEPGRPDDARRPSRSGSPGRVASTAKVPLNRRVTPAMRTATSAAMAASSWLGSPRAWRAGACRRATVARGTIAGERHCAGSGARAPTLPAMGRGRWRVLLAVVGIGAFLSGLELMITAVALPAIVVDLADWTELRAASWIINGYLLVSIVVMPLAGQLADRHGVRRVFLWALVVFVVGSALGGAGRDPRRAGRGQARAGGRRRGARAGGDRRRVAPVRRPGPRPGARRRRRADVPRHGRGTVRRGLGPTVHPSDGECWTRSGSGAAWLTPARVVALRVLPERADRFGLARRSGGRRPPAGRRHGASTASTSGARPRSRWGSARCSSGSRSPAASRSRSCQSIPRCSAGSSSLPVPARSSWPSSPRRRRPEPFLDPGWFRSPSFASAAARLAPDGLRLRDRDHRRRGVRRPGALRRPRSPAGGTRLARGGDGRRVRWAPGWCCEPSACG